MLILGGRQESSPPVEYLQMVRDASLEYGSVPNRDSVYGEERDRWERYLAQRFGKPKTEVTEADWERANNWKIPSLVGTSLDARLRQIEVERARTTWVDIDNGVLRIPKEESSKNTEHWIVSLQNQTGEM